MTIKLSELHRNAFGAYYEPLASNSVFVFTDEGRVFRNPTILETDDDIVVFKNYAGDECMGTAVALPFLTPAEAIHVARELQFYLEYNGRAFAWSRGTRNRLPQWCAGFVKKRGTRIHLVPASVDDCVALIEGTKKITYWTNSRRCEIVAA